jgi:hypothetical protein
VIADYHFSKAIAKEIAPSKAVLLRNVFDPQKQR